MPQTTRFSVTLWLVSPLILSPAISFSLLKKKKRKKIKEKEKERAEEGKA
jgi:hypothetical protein